MAKKKTEGKATESKPQNENEVTSEVPDEEKTETAAAQDNAANKELEDKCRDVSEKYMRVLAEYDNYRKRTIKEKESIYPEAKAVVVEKFLDVLDNLERALQSAQSDNPLYEGVSLVKKQMEDVLSALGVEAIQTTGEAFDPLLHEAVMHIDDENLGESVICEEFRKGYRIGERIVRHSMVKVAN